MRSILMTVVVAAGSTTLLAQMPPVRMGLWEKTVLTSTGEGSPATMKARSCITAEQWQEMTSNIQKPHPGCKMDVVKTGNGYTFHGVCTPAAGSSLVMNGSQTIQDPEHIVSQSQSTTTMNGKVRKIEVHSTSRFLSSSCGSVKPGEPDIEGK